MLCLVLGEVPAKRSLFAVSINDEIKIASQLRSEIHRRKGNAFIGVDENELILWKVNIPINDENLGILDDTSREVNIKSDFKGKELFPADAIPEDYCKQQPPEVKIIHIIVQPPPTTTVLELTSAQIIMKRILELSKNPDVYSNPKISLSLPFPFPGSIKPVDRFTFNDDGSFTFMGRKEFKNVLDQINNLRTPFGYMEMFIYGTMGYGKSYILSAITCYLFRIEKRVVYLPDCHALSLQPVNYIKSALFLTYVNDSEKIDEISQCKTLDDIICFFESVDETLYIIIDQLNGLDEKFDTGINSQGKIEIKNIINKMRFRHFYIKSASENNEWALQYNKKQTNELKIPLYGGFKEEEMKEWWNKYYSTLPGMDNQQKAQIEDMTGKIPLFLSLLLLKSSYKNFEDVLGYLNQNLNSMIQKPMMEFLEEKSKDTVSWDRLMSSFIMNSRPPTGYRDDDYDHRYFYIGDNNKCHYVCGFIRDSIAEYLLEKEKMEIFTDIKWIGCIEDFKNNPSVVGFFVEKACIASIFKCGLMAFCVNFMPSKMECFYDENNFTISLNTGECMFCIPFHWNQKAIDGLLISQKKDKLYVAPVQITLNKDSHSDSEEAFFSSIWPKLKPKLSRYNYKLEIMFIWITQRGDNNVSVEHLTKKTRNGNYEINPNYIRVVTGFVNVNKDIDTYLKTVITNNDRTKSQIITNQTKRLKNKKCSKRKKGKGKTQKKNKVSKCKMKWEGSQKDIVKYSGTIYNIIVSY